MKLILICIFLLITIVRNFNFREVQTTQTTTVINVLANYTFRFDRTTDNTYDRTPYDNETVPANGTVTITFPNDYTVPNTATCLSASIDAVAISTYGCQISGNTITFKNLFTNVANLFVSLVIITVGNILNPSPAIITGTFSGSVGIDIAVPAGFGVQLRSGNFAFCGLTFDPGYVNLATSKMVFSITPTNSLTSSSTLTILFPRNTWTNDISNQVLPITSTMACNNMTANVQSGIQCAGNSASLSIRISNIFTTSVTTNFQFSVSNFLSPPTGQPSDAISITSYINNFQVDTCTVYPSNLIPNNFNSLTITPLSTMTVNRMVGLRFDMNLAAAVDQNDIFSVTFPSGTVFTYANCFGTGIFTTPTVSGQTVLISQNTSYLKTYGQNSNFSISLSNFQAPPSTLPTSSITIQILRNGYAKMIGGSSVTAVTGTLSGTVSLGSTTVWANTSNTFTITISNGLSSSGMIKITFPSTMTLAMTSSSCATLVGTAVVASPFCTINADNSITISSLNSSSANIPAQTLRLTILGVINPRDTQTTSSFSVVTYHSSNLQGLVDSGSIAGATSTQGTISSFTVSVVPSSYTVLQTSVSYTFIFNNTYLIPLNGYIVIQIPFDISISMGSISSYCKVMLSTTSSFSSTSCTGTTLTSFYQITFTSVAQSASIPANTQIQLQISSLCTNPTNTRIITPFAINTYTPTGAIEGLSNGITVQMNTPAALTVNIARSSQQNSALASYTFTLKQQAALPAGSLVIINFPSSITLNNNSTCTDSSSAILNCAQSGLQNLIVTINAIAQNTQFSITVSNIMNPPSYKPLSSGFVCTTKTSDQVSTYASGTSTNILTNSVPSLFQSISATFSPGAYNSSQSMTISLTPSPQIIPSSFTVILANSFTIVGLTCGSFIGFTASCSPYLSNGVTVSGTMGSSQMIFTITGFNSPLTSPSDYTIVSSFDSTNNLIDQSSNNIKYGITCTLPCKTCTTVPTQCLSCYSNSLITVLPYYYSNTKSCLSSCPTGYYIDSSTNICQACSSLCLKCSIINTNCTQCNSTSNYPALNIVGSTGTCLAACPSLYYLDNTLIPPSCTPCVAPCVTCTAKAACLTCKPTYYLDGTTCTQNCPSSYTIPNNATNNCDPCSTQCATCSGNINTCLTCSSKAALYLGQCVTSCPYPLVINNGACADCNINCKTCIITATNCSSCYTNSSSPYLTTKNNLGSCSNLCDDYYYGDLVNGLCQSCASLPINCKNCSSVSTCYACDPGFVLYNSQCLNYTPTGFYNNSGVASPCNSTCATCNNSNQCLSCKNTSLLGSICYQICPNYTASVNLVCTSCTPPCLTCSGTVTFCTSCIANLSTPVFLNNGFCVPSCPNYTYASNSTCNSCTSPCQSCSGPATCSTCLLGYFFSSTTSTCVVNCPSGYVGIGRSCYPCTSNCKTCLGSQSNCLSCNSNFYLYNTSSPSCLNPCPNGLYPKISNQICTTCQSPCAACSTTSTTCTSCLTGILINNTCSNSSCDQGYYQSFGNCIVCPSQCTICSSAANCSYCASGYSLDSISCVNPCPSARPVNKTSVCLACSDSSCYSCDHLDNCLQCYYPTILFSGKCLTSCPKNYSLNQTTYTCYYKPINNGTDQQLTSSLTASSLFPVPFTLTAAFLGIACLMSKFQHEQTYIAGSLYSLWGFLQWGSIIFVMIYYYLLGKQINSLQMLLLAGSLGFNYILNLIFIFTQNLSLKNDKKLKFWLEGSLNSCWYISISFIALLTTNKFKNILFCKLFNFKILTARLQNISKLRVYYAYSFISFISSASAIVASVICILNNDTGISQLFMGYIDILVLSVACIILAIMNSRKDENFFQQITQDGFPVNKRIQSFDQILNQQIMPKFDQEERHTYNQKNSIIDSQRKFNYSDSVSLISIRDVSIQADPILGERSRISRLGTNSISDLGLWQPNDRSVQINYQKSLNDQSIDQTHKQHNEISVQYSNNAPNQISIQYSIPRQDEFSIQNVPLYNDQQVDMTKHEGSFGIQCNADQNNISIQYSAKPVFQNIEEDLLSDSSPDDQTDVQNYNKMIENIPARQDIGLKADNSIQIDEQLLKKQLQLQKLQQQRRQRQKQQAIEMFQRKQYQQNSQEFNHRETKQLNNHFNNDQTNQHNSSAIDSNAQIDLGFNKRRHQANMNDADNNQVEQLGLQTNYKRGIPSAFTERQYIQMLNKEDDENIDFSLSINDENHDLNYQNHKRKLKQPAIILEENKNLFEDRFDQNIEQNDDSERYIPRDDGMSQNQGFSAQLSKSRSTNIFSRAPPLPNKKKNDYLEDSQSQQIQKSLPDDEEVIHHPVKPKLNRNAQFENRRERDNELAHQSNLTQFLEKKKRNLISAQQVNRKNILMEEEDVLSKQIQRDRQRPLMPQKTQVLKSQYSVASSYKKINTKDIISEADILKDLQFDNEDKIQIFAQGSYDIKDETHEHNNSKDQRRKVNKNSSEKQFQKPIYGQLLGSSKNVQNQRMEKLEKRNDSTKNKIKQIEVMLQRPSSIRNKGYMKQTHSSEEKKKSLQKIYLNKVIKR